MPGVADAAIFGLASTRDFIDYGLEPEFIGRLPVRVVCEDLSAADLFEIMNRSEGSIIRQYERAFRAFGVEVFFEEEALRIIAERASGKKPARAACSPSARKSCAISNTSCPARASPSSRWTGRSSKSRRAP